MFYRCVLVWDGSINRGDHGQRKGNVFLLEYNHLPSL